MSSDPHLFLCNGATLARAAREWSSVEPESLRTGDGGNVRIEIPALAKKLAANVAPVFADLTEIAAFVFAADQAIERSKKLLFDYGDKWIRKMRLEIAVRCPDFWNHAPVIECLTEALGFLTEDLFEFRFSANKHPTPFESFLGFGVNPEGIERVVLFSGGIDSLAGAVEEIVHHRRKVALVSHSPVTHIGARQARLVSEITERAPSKAMAPLHLTVLANKVGKLDHEHTQRSRSFLFTSMAAVVCHVFGIDGIQFYENGIVSVNLPLCDQEVNARASRTTHPQTLYRFTDLLSKVFSKPMPVTNHYLSLTKQDVVERLKALGHADLIANTVSCTHTRGFTSDRPHCGLCAQCMSRRFATLGADVERFDPDSRYRSKVLLEARSSTPERTLAERFVGVARQIEKMKDYHELQLAFANDLARVTPFLDGSSRDVLASMFDLHHRHATQIGSVITESIARYAGDYREERLPDTSTLWFAIRLAQSRMSGMVEGKAQDGGSGQSSATLSKQVQRLNAIDRQILVALAKNNATKLGTDLPNQEQIANWIGRPFDASLKAALAALVKAELLDNGRHHGKRGGYFLTRRGELAVELIEAKVRSSQD